jgi:cobalt/nickel transport system permease protein
MKPRRRAAMWGFAVGAVLVALLLAAFASPFASTQPDGLNRVAIDNGFDEHAKANAVDDSPLAGYSVQGVQHANVSKGLSGIAGVLISLAVASLLFSGLGLFIRRRSCSPPVPATG